MIGPETVFKGHNMMGPNGYIYTVNHLYNEELHMFKESSLPITVTI